MNRNWPRWIQASVSKAFLAVCEANSLHMYLEGGSRRTQTERTYTELRIDGPQITEQSKGYWQLDIVVDVLIVSSINNENIYTMQDAVGTILLAFTTDIPVFKLGLGEQDDGSQFGCLTLTPNLPDSIIVTNFGQPVITSQQLQSTVEAAYRMNLRG